MNGMEMTMCVIGFILVGIAVYVYKPHSLNTEQKKSVMERGLVHFTSEKAADLIMESSMLKERRGKKHTYFYLNVPIAPNYSKFNRLEGEKLSAKIIIENLTPEQIDKLKVRYYDLAISYPGNFYFLEENKVSSIKQVQLMANITNFILVTYLIYIIGSAGVVLIWNSNMIQLIMKCIMQHL